MENYKRDNNIREHRIRIAVIQVSVRMNKVETIANQILKKKLDQFAQQFTISEDTTRKIRID